MFHLPENNRAPNLLARKWLVEARTPLNPSLLFVTQLAYWGLEKGVEVHSQVDEDVLQDQVNLLLAVKENAGREQANAYQWLLSNPNGPPLAEQERTLQRELASAKDPLEAAAAVLETVSDRMAAASAPSPE